MLFRAFLWERMYRSSLAFSASSTSCSRSRSSLFTSSSSLAKVVLSELMQPAKMAFRDGVRFSLTDTTLTLAVT